MKPDPVSGQQDGKPKCGDQSKPDRTKPWRERQGGEHKKPGAKRHIHGVRCSRRSKTTRFTHTLSETAPIQTQQKCRYIPGNKRQWHCPKQMQPP